MRCTWTQTQTVAGDDALWMADPTTPLSRAAANERLNVLSSLLAQGEAVDARDAGDREATPLMAAAHGDAYNAAAMLLNKGAAVEAADGRGWRALHYAAAAGHDELVQLLLERKADRAAVTEAGETARALARKGAIQAMLGEADGAAAPGAVAAQKEPPPEPPEKPDPLDCCGSGCTPCVYDTYYEELDAYERELAEWEERNGQFL